MGPRLCECCRQGQAEVVSNSRNKIHQTWRLPFYRSLYVICCVVGNLAHTHVAYASVTAIAVVKLGTKMAPKQLLCVTPPHFLTPTPLASAHSLSLSLSLSLRSPSPSIPMCASVEMAVEDNDARNCVVKY